MTCGQTFCWHRVSGKLYAEDQRSSEGAESGEESPQSQFYTFRNGEPIIIEETEEGLVAETELDKNEVKKALGLDRDLEEIFAKFPDDEKLFEAKNELWGLRIIQDEFFPCLISYLCSPQMRIPRIKEMHNLIAEKFGEVRTVKGIEMRRFPTLEELSEASEEELRDLGVGYRAKYIVETVKILQEGFDVEKVREMEYEEAREELKSLYGVGDKVADCVLLFSLGFYEAYPIDTWASQLIESQYPELFSEDYEELSENVRSYFGEDAGYAQEYLFHAARKGILET